MRAATVVGRRRRPSTRYSPGRVSCTAAASSRCRARRRRCRAAPPKRISRLPRPRISSSGGALRDQAARSMITTRSATRSASSRSWVVSTHGTRPSRAQVGDDLADELAPCGSTPAVGSSRNATSGRPTRASASDSRCCSPPDSWRQVRAVGGRSARPARAAPPGSAGRRRRRRTAAAPRAAGCRGTRRPPAASRRSAGDQPAWSASGSRPRTRTAPDVGPPVALEASRSVEVLPAPLGPSTRVTSPASAVKREPSTARDVAVADGEVARPRRAGIGRDASGPAEVAVVAYRGSRVPARAHARHPPHPHRTRRGARPRSPAGATAPTDARPDRSSSTSGSARLGRRARRRPRPRSRPCRRRSAAPRATARPTRPRRSRPRAATLGDGEQALAAEADAARPTRSATCSCASPTCPRADAPDGAGEHDNVVVRGSRASTRRPTARTSGCPHWDIGAELGILDVERAVKISGVDVHDVPRAGAPRSPGPCASSRLDRNADAYEEIRPPDAWCSPTRMIATGHLPKFDDDAYHLERDDLWAIPTAEVPLTSLAPRRDPRRGRAAACGSWPTRSCFRREAGSAGRDTRGLLRVHEFDKVEILAYATPEQAAGHARRVLARAEATHRATSGLAYRVLDLCTGDLGNSAARTFDIEVYAPGVDQWLEVSSVSWFSDYQARRANIRYRPAGRQGHRGRAHPQRLGPGRAPRRGPRSSRPTASPTARCASPRCCCPTCAAPPRSAEPPVDRLTGQSRRRSRLPRSGLAEPLDRGGREGLARGPAHRPLATSRCWLA